MEEFSLSEAIITSTITLTGGIILFILNEWYTNVLRKPIDEYKRIKIEVSKNLVYYCNIYTNPIDITVFNNNEVIKQERITVMNKLRELASEYLAIVENISHKWFFRLLRAIPSNANIKKVVGNLIGLSNSLTSTPDSVNIRLEQNLIRYNDILKILKLKFVGDI